MPRRQDTTSGYTLDRNCTVTKCQSLCVSQTHLEEAEIFSKPATQSPFSAPSNPLPTSGPGPTQISKHSEEYKYSKGLSFHNVTKLF